MVMVVGECVGTKPGEGVGRCRGSYRVRCDALVAPVVLVRNSGSGLPGKALARDAMRRLPFVVHAVGWLHCTDAVAVDMCRLLLSPIGRSRGCLSYCFSITRQWLWRITLPDMRALCVR